MFNKFTYDLRHCVGIRTKDFIKIVKLSGANELLTKRKSFLIVHDDLSLLIHKY